MEDIESEVTARNEDALWERIRGLTQDQILTMPLADLVAHLNPLPAGMRWKADRPRTSPYPVVVESGEEEWMEIHTGDGRVIRREWFAPPDPSRTELR